MPKTVRFFLNFLRKNLINNIFISLDWSFMFFLPFFEGEGLSFLTAVKQGMTVIIKQK